MATLNMNRSNIWIIVVVALILLIALFWKPISRLFSAVKSEAKTEQVVADSLTKECEETNQITFNMTGEEIRRLIEENAALTAENEMLKQQLEDCIGAKKPTKSSGKATRTKSTVKQKPASTQSTEKVTRTPAVSTKSRSGENNLAIVQYESFEVGDVGAAFDNTTSELYYFLAVDIPDNDAFPRDRIETYLNSKNGVQGQIYGNYIRYYTGNFITVDMLDRVWWWAIYIGDHTSYGFDMWLPTELVKNNNQVNPDPSLIRPNKTLPIEGQQGYEFYSPITSYKAK